MDTSVTESKDQILIYIFDDMADFEITLLAHLIVGDSEVGVTVISDELRTIRSASGMLFQAHKTIREVDPKTVKGIIIPGGWIKNMSEALIKLVQDLNRENKLIAAICAGPMVLAKAGLLQDRAYTTAIIEWKDKHQNFFNSGDPFPRQHFKDERVVRDHNIITAKGVAFVDFSVEVCDYLNLFKDEAEKEDFVKRIKG